VFPVNCQNPGVADETDLNLTVRGECPIGECRMSREDSTLVEAGAYRRYQERIQHRNSQKITYDSF